MLENKKNVRKIRNILIVLMAITAILCLNPLILTAIDAGNGTINPIYKPKWEKIGSTINTNDKTLTVTLKGYAEETLPVSGNVSVNYTSDVISKLTTDKILVYVDGVLDGDDNKNGLIDTGETPRITKQLKILNASGEYEEVTDATQRTGTELTYQLILSSFEDDIRQTGASFKEWSGNIKLKILGRGQDISTYNANVLSDKYGSSVDASGNITLGLAGNQNMMETDQNGTNADGTWIDVTFGDTKTDHNTNGTMFADFIHPEFTYRYSETIIGNGGNSDENYKDTKKVIVVFDVIDKYFNSNELSAAQIDINLLDTTPETTIPDEEITKTLTRTHAIIMSADGTVRKEESTVESEYVLQDGETKVGERLELLVEGLEQKYDNPELYKDENGNIIKYSDGYTYSGPMSITIPAGKIKDKSGNENNQAIITIGVDETDGNEEEGDSGSQEIVDVVDPVWEFVSSSIESGTITIQGKDKYFKESTIDVDNIRDSILVYVNGAISDVVGKTITSTVEIEDGIQYTIQVTNLEAESGYVTPFTPTSPVIIGNATYSNENGGQVEIEMARGTIVDEYGNENEPRKFQVGNSDSSEVQVFNVQQTHDADANTVTTVFNVTDRNYDATDLIELDEITIWIDGVQVEGLISDESALTAVPINTPYSLDGLPTKTVGHQYTLVLSNIQETLEKLAESGRKYRDLSGTFEIRIDKDAARDTNGNTLQTALNSEGDYVEAAVVINFTDFIKPLIQYKEQSQDASEDEKSYTLKFDITDKYIYYPTEEEITAGQINQLKLDDLTITMQNGQYEQEQDADGNWQFKLDGNGNKIPIIYDLVEEAKKGLIDIEFADTEIINGGVRTRTSDVTEITVSGIKATNRQTNLVKDVNDYVIGHSYTLKISNLEQLGIKDGNTTLDYSGIVTVNIVSGKVKDTSGNTNNSKTITSQINVSGSGVVEQVDVVDPLVEKITTSAYAVGQTASLKVRITDTYFVDDEDTTDDESTLTIDEIQVVVDGSVVTEGITINPLSDVTILNEERSDGTTHQYGVEYDISISGYATSANQVKIRVLEDSIKDASGNGNKQTDLIVYNVLKKTNTETAQASVFLGHSTLQRQNIENVKFKTLTKVEMDEWASLVETDNTYWDVSANIYVDASALEKEEDKSIVAHFTDTNANGAYEVTIGSHWEIFANRDSSYLLANIGYSTSCKAEETITNLNLLNTSSVTNMNHMFYQTGYNSMSALNLVEFDTTNVTNMESMFCRCGNNAMTTFNIGTKFNTSQVVNMKNMFYGFGNTALTSLDLSSGTDETNTTQFNTNNVTHMGSMFYECGQNAMITLNLGNNFNTENVTIMDAMFSFCGQNAMTTFRLGSKFNTKKVTNMTKMFMNCGEKAITTLDLGDLFNTEKVTNMSQMFYYCGYEKLQKLDLGEKFDTSNVTNMEMMFYRTGNELMTKLDLGDKFNTAKVKNMYRMFYNTGGKNNEDGKILTSLDLGDLFYTTSAENMIEMFCGCGNNAMTTLDLGPAFTRIPSGNITYINSEGNNDTKDAHYNMFSTTGKSGECTIYAPEAIYSNNTTFKTGSASTTTIAYTNGTINSIYRPEWEKVANGTTIDIGGKTLTVTVKGSAYKTQTVQVDGVDTTETIYASDVISEFENGDITVFIDGVEVTSTTNPQIVPDTGTQSTNATSGKKEVTNKIVISNLEEAYRQTDPALPYKEWSGNVSIKLASGTLIDSYGSYIGTDGEGNSIPVLNVSKDADENIIANQNLGATQSTDGTWINVTFEDAEKDKITAIDETIEIENITTTTPVYMFTDFIHPEFTYKYSETKIGNGITDDGEYKETKKVMIAFDVTDKYFNNVTLLESDITVKLIDTTPETTIPAEDITKTLTKTKYIIMRADGTKEYEEVPADGSEYTLQTGESKVGERYELLIEGLEQKDADGFPDGTTYSGPMSITIPSGKITDKSGNINNQTTITVGVDETDGNEENGDSGNQEIVDVVDPMVWVTDDGLSGRNGLSAINRTDKTVSVVVEGLDKYLDTSKQNLFNTEFKEKIKVRIIEHDGDIIEDASTTELKLTKADGTVITDQTTLNAIYGTKRIQKTITGQSASDSSIALAYKISLNNFGDGTDGTNAFEGTVSVIIPEDSFVDLYGNGNLVTEVFVGNSTNTDVFKDSIVDFTKPTWNYSTSSISRDRNDVMNDEGDYVTVKIIGHDNYYTSNSLTKELIDVYIDGVKNTNIEKDLQPITDATELTNLATKAGLADKIAGRTITEVVYGYTLTLSNFGTNDGQVNIVIPQNQILDTSNNGNKETTIYVGNPEWVEDNEPLETTDTNYPAFDGFRTVENIDGAGNTTISGSIVDFIKPEVTLGTATLDRTNSEVTITFDVTDRNYVDLNTIATNVIDISDIKIFVDTGNNEKEVTSIIGKDLTRSTEQISKVVDGKTVVGYTYTLTLDQMQLADLIDDEVFLRHSGVIKLVIIEGQVADTSGNYNKEETLIVNEFIDGEETIGIADFIKPIIYIKNQYVDWEDKFALITLRATDRFYLDTVENVLKTEHITLYEEYTNEEGNVAYRDITSRYLSNMQIIKSPPLKDLDGNTVGYDYTIKITGFEEEFKLKIGIAAGIISDTSGNTNDAYTLDNGNAIISRLDNKRPYWKYVSSDTTEFHSNGKLSFTVNGLDKFLDFDESLLEAGDLKLVLDGNILENPDITVTYVGNTEEDDIKYETYKIDITGLTQIGTYSLVFAKDTLVDEDENKSVATTISFSKSMISYDDDNHNTNNYTNITYHISPDQENIHSSNVHELMSVNATGTNYQTTTFRPSSIGEIFNNGENPSFTEPMYDPKIAEDGYTVTYKYSPKSFAGWAEAKEDGTPVYYTDATLQTVSETETTYMKIYGLYDEIPNTITNLRAVLQNAKVVFVSSTGSDSNDGKFPTSPVQSLTTAYSMLNENGSATSNIIVIKDAVEWSGNTTLTGNATITSTYAGKDYRKQGAELKISSNMVVDGDIIFDNIELYSSSSTVSSGTDYLSKGTYTNMLISNYSGDITLGRGITTTNGDYTFGAIVGGNLKTETSIENLGTHTIRVEAGKYNNIIAGSTLTTSTDTAKFVTHQVVIGNKRDTAIPRNTKLTITGYVAIGENEKACYPDGATGTGEHDEYNIIYSDVTLYSGTFTGVNKFKKSSEDAVIYVRSINGQTGGTAEFKMYGGIITGNIYAGARTATQNKLANCNTINFYGGELTGNVFGQGATDVFTGSTIIALQGCFSMTGNVFGGSNATAENTGNGTGNANISVNTSSVTVTGNIYGGSNGINNSGYITGTTTITLNAGNVSNIYGSGKNSGHSGTTTIKIENGGVSGNIVGGAYNGQGGTNEITSTITVLGGTIGGNIYGGNENTAESYLTSDTAQQNVIITIGDTDVTKAPTISGTIYGSGKYDKLNTVEINLIECLSTPSVFGGSAEANGTTETVSIKLNGMTVNEIYGGGQNAGTVKTATIKLLSGTATEVYGGGYKSDVENSYIELGSQTEIDGIITSLEGNSTVTTIYGGSNAGGIVNTANVSLYSGNITNVFGGGNSAEVQSAYTVALSKITINTIHGGSKDAEITNYSQVVLAGSNITNVFGGGFDGGTTKSYIMIIGGETAASMIQDVEETKVTNIYGGSNSTESGTGGNNGSTNIEIIDASVGNIYGGNYLKGITQNSYITIQDGSTVTGKLYGGGYNSNIGTSENSGTTTINIVGGTINNDINGGSEEGTVYGTININIGEEVFDDNAMTANGAMQGNITILGNIYGSGSTTNSNYETVSVVGDTHITMDNSTDSPITFSGSIFGAGKGSTYDNGTDTDESTIFLKDFGTSEGTYQIKSIERTGDLYIGKSFIELLGRQDQCNANKNASYTLNRITNALTIYDNTTLYTRRGFNMVGGFNSYVGIVDYGDWNIVSTAVAEATISTSSVTTNTDNRLYTFEGVNLIFTKEEGDIYQKANDATNNIWGDVNGMTFFGMYALDRTSGEKVFDIYAPDSDIYYENYEGDISTTKFFKNGTYVEGKDEGASQRMSDGFYTNVATYGEDTVTIKPQAIGVTDGGNYVDWIINEDIVNYSAGLIASISGAESMADILLDYRYASNATYQIDTVSLNALNIDVNLINPLEVPVISANAHNTLGLTMKTDVAGWLNKASTNIYTSNSGSFEGDSLYKTDDTTTPGKIRFKLHNSVNITETIDLGFVNIVLVGKTPEIINADGSITSANTFKVVITLNLQTKAESQEQDYVPRFTDYFEKQLNYTQDSKIDLTYTLYKETDTTIYPDSTEGYYRALTTTTKLPAGTRITMKDYVTGKVYYYHVTGTETEYKLSNFIEMDSTDAKYSDDSSIYFIASQAGIPAHAVEKYDISIDFIDAVDYIDESVATSIAQQTYLELKDSEGNVKFDNGENVITYNLYSGKNAKAKEIISNSEISYSVVEALEIPLTLDVSLLEQGDIKDTKYYDKIAGISLQIVDENGSRIRTPELQNFTITNNDTDEIFEANSTGVIRVPLMETLSTIKDNYTITVEQSNVPPGEYTCLIQFYTAEDGLYYGSVPEATQKFYITFINKLAGTIGVEASPDSRIINKTTGENLEGNIGVDMIVSVGSPTSDTNIRVELFKRNITCIITEDNVTYTEISYTSVDISQYLEGTWEKPSAYGLTAANDNEYIISPKENYDEIPDLKTIDFEKTIKSGISTGEYKLVFKAYSNNIEVQTAKKTFIVAE